MNILIIIENDLVPIVFGFSKCVINLSIPFTTMLQATIIKAITYTNILLIA